MITTILSSVICTTLFIYSIIEIKKFFIRTFWAERTLGMLEFYIEKSFNLIVVTILEPSNLIGDQIDRELPIIRKKYFENLLGMLGPHLSKHCLYLFGSTDNFTRYVSVRFEELFRVHGVAYITKKKQIQGTGEKQIKFSIEPEQ